MKHYPTLSAFGKTLRTRFNRVIVEGTVYKIVSLVKESGDFMKKEGQDQSVDIIKSTSLVPEP